MSILDLIKKRQRENYRLAGVCKKAREFRAAKEHRIRGDECDQILTMHDNSGKIIKPLTMPEHQEKVVDEFNSSKWIG